MPRRPVSLLCVVTVLLVGVAVSARATVIGPNQTVLTTDPSLVGENINFQGKLTSVISAGMPAYDTGAALLEADSSQNNTDFTNALGTGPNEIQWTGSGGFMGNVMYQLIVVNVGGQTPSATLTWGQDGFVPNGSALVLGGAQIENTINLGADTSATRQIDIADLGPDFAVLAQVIKGSGNLSVQPYGPASTIASPVSARRMYASSIDVTGTVLIDNVTLLIDKISASRIILVNQAELVGITSQTDLTLSGTSFFGVAMESNPPSSLRELLGQLNCFDPTSGVALGEEEFIAGSHTFLSGVLVVHGGYFAGKISDGVTTDQETQYPDGGSSLIKDGSDYFTLAADNSSPQVTVFGTYRGYSRGTTVEGGTLLVTNSAGSATGTGSVTINAGANLGGDGNIAPSAGHRLYVGAGAMVDLRASDPAHPMSDPTHALGIRLVPNTRATFATGSSFGFNLNGDGRSNRLAFSGLTANQTQVFLNNNAVTFTKLPAVQPGIYTIMTFDQGGAYSGTLAPQAGCKFIYAPKAVQVQIF